MFLRFTLQTLAWATGLAVIHSGLRAVTGTSGPTSFLGDLTFFAAAMLALAALPAGIAASRDFSTATPAALRQIFGIGTAGAILAVVSYGIVDQVAPRAYQTEATATVEPAGLTSSELRTAGREAAARAEALDAVGQPSIVAWQTVNRIAFAHELRIVQSLLLPIMGLIGLLAGERARRVGRPWQTAMLWGLGLFLVFAMFMAGENGYELIVLRSSGPMAFVAWLQAVVPGSVLVGLAFAALTSIAAPPTSASPTGTE